MWGGGHDGQDGHLSKSKTHCQNPHYKINILIFIIIVRKMTISDIHFDQNDLDHFDHFN